MNYFNTAILLATPGFFFVTLGYLLGDGIGVLLCSGVYLSLAIFACRSGERLLLGKHRAIRLPEDQSPGLHSLVRQLAQRAAIPVPTLYLLPEAAPQLMVAGLSSKRGSIAMSAGLLKLLGREELAAVIADAIDLLRSGEVRTMTMAAVLAHALISVSNIFRWSRLPGLASIRIERQDGIPSDAFLWVVFAPLAAGPIRAFVYPARLFRADDASTRLIGDPEPLCSALLKIEAQARYARPAIISLATAHLFLCSPHARQGGANLFRTHPSIEKRIHRLRTISCRSRFSAANSNVAAF